MIIAVDFDGTCVTHEYPKIGRDIGAVPVLKELVSNGHKLILWTMRSNVGLKEATQWFEENDIILWGVQRNPEQDSWTKSPKAYANLYIDDAALGCPLVRNEKERDYVDWVKVRRILIQTEYIEISKEEKEIELKKRENDLRESLAGPVRSELKEIDWSFKNN